MAGTPIEYSSSEYDSEPVEEEEEEEEIPHELQMRRAQVWEILWEVDGPLITDRALTAISGSPSTPAASCKHCEEVIERPHSDKADIAVATTQQEAQSANTTVTAEPEQLNVESTSNHIDGNTSCGHVSPPRTASNKEEAQEAVSEPESVKGSVKDPMGNKVTVDEGHKEGKEARKKEADD
jgi:hypothetical protein